VTSNQQPHRPTPPLETRPGETELLRALFILWTHKKFIIGCTFAITLLGAVRAIQTPPQFYSEATFTLKGSGKENASSIFAQFGGLAAQLGGSTGSTTIAKTQVMLEGHELAESIVADRNLMPVLFSKFWDARSKKWKVPDAAHTPTLRAAGNALRGNLVLETDEKKGMIHLGINYEDPELAKKFVEYYLVGLNNMMRKNVIEDAELNRKFLEAQMSNTTDPVLIEQLNQLVAVEVQKVMFASSNSLEILEHPQVALQRSKPKRKQLVIIAFLAGVLVSVTSVFLWQGFKKIRATFRRYHSEADSTARSDLRPS
jgi:uncharacterized protein involved in exopolysaccharide biosynthesis